MNDDDLIRRALRPPPRPFLAPSALRDLQPTFKRRQRRRRAVLGATGAIVLSGSAAALALSTQPTETTLRISGVPSIPDDAEAPTTASMTSLPSTSIEPDDALSAPPADTTAPLGAEAPVPSAPGISPPSAQPAPNAVTVPNAPPITEPATTMAPTTAPTTPETTAASPVTQSLVSDCGTIVVVIQDRSVRIVSMAPVDGYTASVGDDGPESIEVEFTGPAGKCEVHAELKRTGLDIEIQNPESHD